MNSGSLPTLLLVGKQYRVWCLWYLAKVLCPEVCFCGTLISQKNKGFHGQISLGNNVDQHYHRHSLTHTYA